MARKFWFWALLGLGMVLRLYGIANPLLDNHAWRQTDTASMAANLLQSGFFPPLPQLDYDGPPPNYAELEFPLVPLLTALLWKIFGQSDILARAVVLAFSAGALVLIFYLGEVLYDSNSGLLGMAFFAVNPMAIYYGRSVMPESAMIFFSLAAVYWLVLWHRTGRFLHLGLAASAFALAVLAKLPAVMLALPLLVLGVQKLKGQILVSRSFWFFVGVGLIPPLLYYSWAHIAAGTRYVSGIVQNRMSFPPPDLLYLRKTLERMVTGSLLVTAMFAPFVRRPRVGNAFIWAWSGVLLVYTLTVCARIQLDYYLFPFIPLLCLLAGGTMGKLWGSAPGVVVSVMMLLSCLNTAYLSLPDYYRVDFRTLYQAQAIARLTRPGDLLILDGAPPMTFYYSGRKGWRLEPGSQTPQVLESLRQKGAKAFVILPQSALKPDLKQYLDRHYVYVRQGGFYDLSRYSG